MKNLLFIFIALIPFISSNGFAQANYEYRWKKISDDGIIDIFIDSNSIQSSGGSYSYISMINFKKAPEDNPGFPVSYIRRGVANCVSQTVQHAGGLTYTKRYGQGPGSETPVAAPVNISQANNQILVLYRYFCK
jgi:hypothetical protein